MLGKFNLEHSKVVNLNSAKLGTVQISTLTIFFKGSFANAQIDLIGNKITKFESAVFEKILEEGGSVNVKGSKFKSSKFHLYV